MRRIAIEYMSKNEPKSSERVFGDGVETMLGACGWTTFGHNTEAQAGYVRKLALKVE